MIIRPSLTLSLLVVACKVSQVVLKVRHCRGLRVCFALFGGSLISTHSCMEC